VSRDASRDLKRRKRELRHEVRARRDALTAAEREQASASIADRFLALPEVGAADSVLAFWSFGSEVETASLIARVHERGARVLLPRIEDGALVPVAYEPGDPVAATSFGAMEPTGDRSVEPSRLDVVVVPGLAFDRRGGRVGYGGGFYDGLLPRLRPQAHAIAIAFSVQLVDEVPEGPGDRRVEAIVTEDEVVRPIGTPG
jgi:5-formyltetrahydrofolate cyclo-ligase